MFNFTPPHEKNVAKCCSIVLVAILCVCAFISGWHAGKSFSPLCDTDAPEPVEISKLLFFNPDSVAYYSAIAAREDDPRALFVAGMAAHLRAADPDYPSCIETVPLDEADYYLLRAAELGSEDAIQYIRCCEYHGTWKHFVPSSNR